MPTTKQRGSSVIYVASSARELPAELQDWLGRAENRAVASPHIYDMLAQLAQGKKFTAIVVNVYSVDWNEMDFFDHAARLSRGTPIFVAGTYSQRAKIEAACRRGAKPFNPELLTEVAAANSATNFNVEAPRATTSKPAAKPADDIKTNAFAEGLRLRWTEAESTDGPREENSPCNELSPTCIVDSAELAVPQRVPISIEPYAGNEAAVGETVESSAIACENSFAEGFIDQAVFEAPLSIEEAELKTEPESAVQHEPDSITEQTESLLPDEEPRIPVRLAPTEEEPEPRIMFPWSAYPDRPRRTPPRAIEPIAPAAKRDVPAGPAASSSFNVRLTPEEIAALMGKPSRSDQAREAP